MKKSIIIVLLLGFIFRVNNLTAQTGDPAGLVKIKCSEYFNNEKLGEYIGNYNYEVYFGYISGEKFVVNIFNSNLELKSSLKQKMDDAYEKLMVDEITIKDGNYVILSHFDNKKLNKTIQFVQRLDIRTFAEKQKVTKVKTIDYYDHKSDGAILTYPLDNDVFIHIYGLKEKGQWGMDISRIGESGDETQKFDFNISDDFNTVHIYENAVSFNDGKNLAVVTRSFKGLDFAKDQMNTLASLKNKKVSSDYIFDYKYYVSFFDLSDEANFKLVNQYEVKSEKSIFIKSLSLKSIDKDKLLITGVYSHPTNFNTKGVYNKTFKYDEISDIFINESYFLDNEFLEKFLGEKNLKERQKDIRKGNIYDYFSYKLNDVVVKEDGSMILAIEKSIYYYEVGVFKASKSHDRTTINYTDFSDIYLTYIAANGKITDVVKVPKFQTQASLEYDFYDSFITKNINGYTYIIYANENKELEGQARKIIIIAVNDNTKVTEQYVTEVYKNTKKSSIILSENWLNDYIILTKATDKLKTKEKVIMLDFTKVMKRK